MTGSTTTSAKTTDGASHELEQRYADVKHNIELAARRAGRSPEDVLLVAVTKYAEPEEILRLVALGHRDFGENRAQQLVQRASMSVEWETRADALPETGAAHGGSSLAGAGVRWHMIGHVQRNKARKVAELCRLVHSVDTLRVAEELQQSLIKSDRVLDVLLQVDCSGEDGKYGCPIPAVPAVADQIESMFSLRLRGLMTMAPYGEDPEAARPVFRRCRELFEDLIPLKLGGGRFDILSMGMTGDYKVAIEEGANIVRVGSAIFGERTHRENDSESEAD